MVRGSRAELHSRKDTHTHPDTGCTLPYSWGLFWNSPMTNLRAFPPLTPLPSLTTDGEGRKKKEEIKNLGSDHQELGREGGVWATKTPEGRGGGKHTPRSTSSHVIPHNPSSREHSVPPPLVSSHQRRRWPHTKDFAFTRSAYPGRVVLFSVHHTQDLTGQNRGPHTTCR